MFFFFKQKTAYEMRISDWSSDVCSSDPAAKDAHAAFLQHLALDGLLKRFARLDEAGQGGVAVRRPAGVPAEQQAAAVGDGDDHRRIGARVVFEFTARAPAEPAGARSEEHTSELQSLMRISSAVFCLKKKTQL